MAKPVNKIKETPVEKKKSTKTPKLPKIAVSGGVHNVLGGNFLTREGAVKLLPYLLFLVFLTMGYIANTYYAERNERDIQSLRTALKEYRNEYITSRSELMKQSQQSEVARRLENINIFESRVPPIKVIHKSNSEQDD